EDDPGVVGQICDQRSRVWLPPLKGGGSKKPDRLSRIEPFAVAPLRGRVEAPDAGEFVAKEFEAQRRLRVRRKQIDNAAALPEVARQLHRLLPRVAMLDEPGEQILDAELAADD